MDNLNPTTRMYPRTFGEYTRTIGERSVYARY